MVRRHYRNKDCKPGMKIGTLTLLTPIRIPINKPPRKTRAGWKCVCECGKHLDVQTVLLHDNISCGAAKHLKSWRGGDRNSGPYHTIYARWLLMLKRCEDPNYFAYQNYGARGIKVCKEWHDYQNFKKWYLEQGFQAPDDSRTTDRIDVNGNYCPENCRLATALEQGQNRRNNHKVLYNNSLMSPREIYNLNISTHRNLPSYNTFRQRIYKGEDPEHALRAPRQPRTFYLFGKKYRSSEAAQEFGISRAAIDNWHNNGLSDSEIEKKISSIR